MKRRFATVLTAFAVMGTASAAPAAPTTPAQLQAATDAFAAKHPTFPGVAVAVVSPRIRWTGTAGHAVAGSSTPLDPLAGFRIASVTKTFTSAAILRLAEQGRLGLDDPIAKHLSPATLALLRSGRYDVDAIH